MGEISYRDSSRWKEKTLRSVGENPSEDDDGDGREDLFGSGHFDQPVF